jgi:hypothetical protein
MRQEIQMRETKRLILLLVTLLLPVVAISDSGFIGDIEGYYAALGRYCSMREGQELVPCNPPSRDCMMIKGIDDTHVKFDVYSVQENGTQCEVSGVAERHGRMLTYIEQGPLLPDHGKGITIHFAHGRITFKYHSEPIPAEQPPFCGARARLDLVEFRLKDREAIDHHTCGNLRDF